MMICIEQDTYAESRDTIGHGNPSAMQVARFRESIPTAYSVHNKWRVEGHFAPLEHPVATAVHHQPRRVHVDV